MMARVRYMKLQCTYLFVALLKAVCNGLPNLLEPSKIGQAQTTLFKTVSTTGFVSVKIWDIVALNIRYENGLAAIWPYFSIKFTE